MSGASFRTERMYIRAVVSADFSDQDLQTAYEFIAAHFNIAVRGNHERWSLEKRRPQHVAAGAHGRVVVDYPRRANFRTDSCAIRDGSQSFRFQVWVTILRSGHLRYGRSVVRLATMR